MKRASLEGCLPAGRRGDTGVDYTPGATCQVILSHNLTFWVDEGFFYDLVRLGVSTPDWATLWMPGVNANGGCALRPESGNAGVLDRERMLSDVLGESPAGLSPKTASPYLPERCDASYEIQPWPRISML